MSKVLWLFSGEWMLRSRPNSGDIVLARSLFIGGWLFLFAIGLDSYLDPNSHLSFSWPAFLHSAKEKLTWFAAAFGAVYAALYSRFSSQWQYLAGLYNQLMAAEDSRPRATLCVEKRKRRMMWWHAFIADAQDLHLALKPTFVGAVNSLLQEPEIVVLMAGASRKEKDEFDEFRKSVANAAEQPSLEAKEFLDAVLPADGAR